MIKKLFSYRFVTATFWMFLATSFLNGGNYLYHLLMGRMLGPQLYGVLASLISLLYILGIPLLTVTFVIVKFTSAYKGKNDYEAIAGLYKFLNRKILVFGLLLVSAVIVTSPLITQFLHLPSMLLVIILVGIFLAGLFNMFTKSFIQGLTNFYGMAVINLGEAVIKLLTAIVLVYLGLQVSGAFLAVGAGFVVGYIISFLFLKKVRQAKGVFSESKKLLSFSLPVLLTNLSLTSLFTTDILLVRHFFPGIESGFYAALSVLGKIIFFAASPATLVMFPLVSEHQAASKKYTHFFLLTIVLTATIVFSLTIIYFVFPELVVGLLFGQDYHPITSLLGYFGIFISLYTLCYLLANFYLSIHKTKVTTLLVIIAFLLQIVAIWFYHVNLFVVIKASIMVTFLLLVSLMLYYPYAKRP